MDVRDIMAPSSRVDLEGMWILTEAKWLQWKTVTPILMSKCDPESKINYDVLLFLLLLDCRIVLKGNAKTNIVRTPRMRTEVPAY